MGYAFLDAEDGEENPWAEVNLNTRTGNSYHATLFWFLRPLGLDFIDNHFEECKRGLFWQGFVNGVPTIIAVELPTIEGFIYEANIPLAIVIHMFGGKLLAGSSKVISKWAE